MANNNSTVIALKTNFLRSQVRLLSQPLAPSERWVNKHTELPGEVIESVVREVNRLLRRHTKSVYPPLSIRHVAEQIDRLYWRAAEHYLQPLRHDDDNDPDINEDIEDYEPPSRDTDLRSHLAIARLPLPWPESNPSNPAHKNYVEKVTQIQALDERRAELERKVKAYKHLLELLKPLEDPARSVQPNLVTRDGALAAELGRTRTLGTRVAARARGWDANKHVDGERLVEEIQWEEPSMTYIAELMAT